MMPDTNADNGRFEGDSQDRLGCSDPAGWPAVDPDQRGHRHHHQHDDFDREQDPLEPGRQLDAAVADVGHRDDPQDPDQQHPAARGVGPIELFGPWNRKNRYCPATWARLPMTSRSAATVAQPPAQPADGPNALVPQMEGGAAVRVGLVQLAEADRAQQHRHEREHRDQRRLQPDGGDDEEQRGGQAVGGRRGSDSDDDARRQAERTGLEPLVPLLFHRLLTPEANVAMIPHG